MNKLTSKAVVVAAGMSLFVGTAAHATRLETLALQFESGATFSGTVAFRDDYSAVLGVNGVLTGYTPTDFSYVGGNVTDPISWVLNPGMNYDYSGTPNSFATYLFDGTPGDFGTVNNVVTFAYDYGAAPNLLLAAVGDGNSVNYGDLAISGSLSPVPVPSALPMFAAALLGLVSCKRRVQP